MNSRRGFLRWATASAAVSATLRTASAQPAMVRSRQNGAWSAASTWEGGTVPGACARVQIADGHRVVYDVGSAVPLRSVHISGVLSFAPDRDTRMDTGLIRIGGDLKEEGFEGFDHAGGHAASAAALEVGTAERPIAAEHTALIRLAYREGMAKQSCPAIVCCGGRMDLHGAPMSRTWVKLGAPAKRGDTSIILAEAVTGWRASDRVILTATTRQIKLMGTFKDSVRDNTQTEERTVKAVQGAQGTLQVTIDAPLKFDHVAEGNYRGDVANLSRNVTIESADPAGIRGHVMYHWHSSGSISYVEFRHLGKEGVLGRYNLHYHLARDTMRGSSVVGASFWDSGNRWLTVHGTDYLVVRDCVGYHSVGHGFFLEDGTETYNVLDRNLAVQACKGKPLPHQVLAFDKNDGAGFWWANSLNSFTGNVAAECDEFGYRFDMVEGAGFHPVLPVRQPDGAYREVDTRTLPFIRFEDNEAHCQRRPGFNLGGIDSAQQGGVAGVGPDERHPFVVRNTRLWNVHWAFHPLAPSVMVDGMDIYGGDYGLWRPTYVRHAYRNLTIREITTPEDHNHIGTKPVEAEFPGALKVVDDLPPATVITRVERAGGKLTVRGTTVDNGSVKRVLVNGQAARAVRPNFIEWEAVVNAAAKVTAVAEDMAGNVEKTGHEVRVG